MSYAPGPSTRRRVPPPPQPRRDNTVRQRPSLQIPLPPGARPPINPSSPTALMDSMPTARLQPHSNSQPQTQTQPSPLSRRRSAEPPTISPKRANGWLQRPLTHTQAQTPTKPWEGSAFTVGAHVSVDDLDWDSGYGGSTQGHQRDYGDYGRPGPSTAVSSDGRRERGAERRRAAMSADSHTMRMNQAEWEKKRWAMDSETSFETASNVRVG